MFKCSPGYLSFVRTSKQWRIDRHIKWMDKWSNWCSIISKYSMTRLATSLALWRTIYEENGGIGANWKKKWALLRSNKNSRAFRFFVKENMVIGGDFLQFLYELASPKVWLIAVCMCNLHTSTYTINVNDSLAIRLSIVNVRNPHTSGDNHTIRPFISNPFTLNVCVYLKFDKNTMPIGKKNSPANSLEQKMVFHKS